MARAGRKEMKIIAGDYEMTFASVDMIERVYREWLAQHPGCTLRDLTPEEFSARMMQAMRASAVRLPVGHA
jgi:uncharacterized SAM-dependent methyltransferase